MKPWAYAIAAVAGVAAIAYFAIRQQELSMPAPLHREHAGLEKDCFVCHVKQGQVESRRCSGCHDDPRSGAKVVLTGFSRHHLYDDLDCVECHREHQGADGDLTRPGHEFVKTECELCHARNVGKGFRYTLHQKVHPKGTIHADHRKWKDDCTACHLEGGGQSAGRCRTCHDPASGQPVQYRHFARHHTYKGLDCLSCHFEHRGPNATILRPGKSIQTAGCKTCHERHVGPDHVYTLASDKHPEEQLHASHERWADECSACHKPGTDAYECASCHDASTGKQMELKGYAKHHTQKELKCLDCHTEHRGRGKGSTTKPGTDFHKVECIVCHQGDVKRPAKLDRLPQVVRGQETVFLHSDHPELKVACVQCHPMKPQEVHVLAKPYDEHCSNCHHGPKQTASCAQCHRKTADYFAGRLDGKLVGKGTHVRSGTVRCRDCHRYDVAAKRFTPTESTCDECHPKSYTPVFLNAKRDWIEWQAAFGSRSTGDVRAETLHFVARNWYHNDKHAVGVRKGLKAQP